ncbi:hypothetical protein BIFGAL_04399 [Bifidobacterium gallicum DSM 20093 = LMG 11596]|uniref:Uncharacterized protein n=1 Tax=Bifidobacterium gallicum DSM 20093 = LMG 11596 TaxID=561180 RepID=D1NWZ2_9BIFI|nr:hypothetical protein BIFGAL_04399 [Bifidobacterium gallicum DSM 20093 = LMG 11596]
MDWTAVELNSKAGSTFWFSGTWSRLFVLLRLLAGSVLFGIAVWYFFFIAAVART